MRAITKIEHRKLADLAENGLKELGFTFLKNGGGDVFEFEVQSPCRCIVSVRNLTQMRLAFPFVARTKVESLIEVRPMLGGEQQGEVVSKAAESIAEALSASIPRKKWKALDRIAP